MLDQMIFLGHVFALWSGDLDTHKMGIWLLRLGRLRTDLSGRIYIDFPVLFMVGPTVHGLIERCDSLLF